MHIFQRWKPLLTRSLVAAAFLVGTSVAAHAQIATNIALNMPVTGTSFYNVGSETFPFANITDGLLNDSGSPSNWSFWLTPDGTAGSATVDLQAVYDVTAFAVQNTHNRGFNDRGTNGFSIDVSTDGSSFNSVVTGNLANVNGDSTIPFENFTIGATPARFVRFTITSFYGNSGGINELEVGGTLASGAPEAPSLALLGVAGLPMLGLLRVTRRRAAR